MLKTVQTDTVGKTNRQSTQHTHTDEDDDEAGNDEDGGEDDDGRVGDYASVEDMQAHHERQILQLSEMHCELLEMNERLQEQLGAIQKAMSA